MSVILGGVDRFLIERPAAVRLRLPWLSFVDGDFARVILHGAVHSDDRPQLSLVERALSQPIAVHARVLR